MAGIVLDDCDEGDLSISGVAMRCPAWYVLRLTPLWQYGDRRGADRVLPGAAGVIANRRRLTVTTYSLPMVITGEADRNGVAQADVWRGFQENIDYLIAQLVVDPGTVTGTRAATLTMPNGSTRTANVHVLAVELGDVVNGRARATLELSLPAGRFV